ncbi:hypothetical protein KHA93_02700 [Bacillus sp. FJAT-49732]|uniref:Uncharacterized protein n=1 Tax=Lederbergia citrisecunda TaxID=2833583 RepID=A0A942YJF4_9BACI|nr:hypothetical protein [Lederbergia citrisecunda]MBS4198557.1 hypothetical protein [Lederbergia citrisecunda]
MSRIKQVAEKSSNWLENIQSANVEIINLRELGIVFCESILSKNDMLNLLRNNDIPINHPDEFPLSLLDMRRNEILSFANNVFFSSSPNKTDFQIEWAQIIGGIAISYARHGDIPVVSALVKIAAILRLKGPLLDESHIFLLDQQNIDGSFGFFDREWKLCNDSKIEEAETHIKLRLTVEVLWALAELSQQPSEENERMHFIV